MSEVSFSSTLFVLRGKDRGRRFELNSRSTSIGRHGTNDIQLLDSKASRRHAEIVFEGSRYKLIDLESSNGTTINDENVEVSYLSSGDKILIGGSLLLFTEGLSISSDGNSSAIKLADMEENVVAHSKVLRSVGAESIPDFNELVSAVGGKGESATKATEQLRILYSASLTNSTANDIDEILQRMLDIIFKLVDARFGCIMLIDEEPGLEIKVQAKKFNDPSLDEKNYETPRVILEKALAENQGILASRRIQLDENRAEHRQVICTPMYGRYGRVGLIYIEGLIEKDDDEEIRLSDSDFMLSRGFSEEQLKLIITIGHQAGTAIEDKIFSTALVHSERMSAIGEIVAMLAHQIKNIMQGIGGGGYMIKQGLADSDPQVIEQGWNIVEKNQGKISDLVLDMLSFSKDREPKLETLLLADIVGEAIEMIGNYAEQSNVEIKNELPETAVVVSVDSEMIQRAIHNLLLNAIDACADGHGEVLVRLERDHEFYYLDISDNGVGIKEANLKRIFSPFTSTKGGRGTGLGLTIARKNCREHGGDLTVQSEHGMGTTFRMSLPVFQDFADVHTDGEAESYDEKTITKFMYHNRDTTS